MIWWCSFINKSMIAMKTILLFGASGLTGQACLSELINDKDVSKVIVLLRKTLKIRHPKVVQQVVDFHDLSSAEQYFNVDEVLCCLGTTIKKAKSKAAFAAIDFDLVINITELAKRHGVSKLMIISSIGANEKSRSFYTATKGKMEIAVKAFELPQTWILRPSLLLGKRDELRVAERWAIIFFKYLAFLFIGPLQVYQPIAAVTVAKAMLRLSHKPLNTENGEPRFTIIENDEIKKIASE